MIISVRRKNLAKINANPFANPRTAQILFARSERYQTGQRRKWLANKKRVQPLYQSAVISLRRFFGLFFVGQQKVLAGVQLRLKAVCVDSSDQCGRKKQAWIGLVVKKQPGCLKGFWSKIEKGIKIILDLSYSVECQLRKIFQNLNKLVSV